MMKKPIEEISDSAEPRVLEEEFTIPKPPNMEHAVIMLLLMASLIAVMATLNTCTNITTARENANRIEKIENILEIPRP